MNGAWVKFFSDGTHETGSDKDIACGRASWSKGRLDGIIEVSIEEGQTSCKLRVEDTEWFQFDRLAAPMAPGVHKPCRTHRVIQAKIKDHHVGHIIASEQNSQKLECWIANGGILIHVRKRITEEDVGKWLTAIIPSRGTPYFVVSERGKLKEKDHK